MTEWDDAQARGEAIIKSARIKSISLEPEGQGFPGSHIELVNEEPPPTPPPHAHMDEH